MSDWSEPFIAQAAIRAQLQTELTAGKWGDALCTARENFHASLELFRWIEARVKNGEAPS